MDSRSAITAFLCLSTIGLAIALFFQDKASVSGEAETASSSVPSVDDVRGDSRSHAQPDRATTAPVSSATEEFRSDAPAVSSSVLEPASDEIGPEKPAVDSFGQSQRAKNLAAQAILGKESFLEWVESSFSNTQLGSEKALINEASVLESLKRVFEEEPYESVVVCSDDVCRLEMPRREYMRLISALAQGTDVLDEALFLSVELIGVHRGEDGRTVAHVVRKDANFDNLLVNAT